MSYGNAAGSGIGEGGELTASQEAFIQNLAGLSYQEGDLIQYSSGVLTRLPIGSEGYALIVSSGVLSWEPYPSATEAVAGIVEFATVGELDGGYDASRAISPDVIAGSNFGERALEAVVFDFTADNTTGDGLYYFTIPSFMDGMKLVKAHARVITAGTTGTEDIQIANVTKSVDVLSTKITIDTGETGSDTAATPYVINTSNSTVNTDDLVRIDIDAIHTTAAKGLIIRLEYRLP